MGDAKHVRVAPISSADAKRAVFRWHYSGRVCPNSQLHLGAFYQGRLLGVMQFGPPLDRRKVLGLVTDTPWNGVLELNRLAFSDRLPRNSESRSLSVAFRLMRRHAQQVQWIVSFADAAQCGDGTIYRAAGFILTAIKRNNQIWRHPDGRIVYRKTMTTGVRHTTGGASSMTQYAQQGFAPIPGFQLRYMYFLDPTARGRLTVPVLPFSRITELGAAMYRGTSRAAPSGGTPAHQQGEAFEPTAALH